MSTMYDVSWSCQKHIMWFDSGASQHVVSGEKWLHYTVNSNIEFVELGGGERHRVKSEGSIIFDNGVRLEKVLFVPTLGINLCSGVITTDKGAKVVLNRTHLSVFVAMEGERVLSGKREKPGYLFGLEQNMVESRIFLC
jgi:hypothetical protein